MLRDLAELQYKAKRISDGGSVVALRARCGFAAITDTQFPDYIPQEGMKDMAVNSSSQLRSNSYSAI